MPGALSLVRFFDSGIHALSLRAACSRPNSFPAFLWASKEMNMHGFDFLIQVYPVGDIQGLLLSMTTLNIIDDYHY